MSFKRSTKAPPCFHLVSNSIFTMTDLPLTAAVGDVRLAWRSVFATREDASCGLLR